MADITMCLQVMCPKDKSCYRRQCKPNPRWQSYMMFPYTISTSVSGIECDGYMPMFKSAMTDSTTTGETNGSRA